MTDDILPTVDYPPMIRGSLRLMLQLKDAFLGSFNLVEEYRDQLLACKHGFTRDLVEYQLTKGLAAITRLREDLSNVESQVRARVNRNVALRQYILQRYSMPTPGGGQTGIVSRMGTDPDGTGTAVLGPALPPPVSAPDSVEQALHGGLNHHKMEVDVDRLEIPPEIDLATATTESGTHLLPVVDFYRGFFFLQMHFQLIMCQAANYAMPVVTRPMSLSERTFSWPTMPSFGLEATNGSMKDRLLEINTDVVALAKRLHDCLGLVREKMDQDRKIESYFMQHTAAQEAAQRNLLRGLQSQRVYMELLESQNDRLAGLAIKLDPNFAKSADFAIMTGPGVTFQDPRKSQEKLTSNQNSAITTAKQPIRKNHDRKPDDDQDGKGGGASGGFDRNHEQNTDYLYNPRMSRNNGAQRTRGYSDANEFKQHSEKHNEGSESEANSTAEMPISDVNFSASGGGIPAIWVQQGTLTSRGHNKTKPVDVDVELTGKLGEMRGHSQAVEQLLIGVESFTQGRRKRGYEQHPTSSFLNTEHHVPSIVDDVLGQLSQDPTIRKSLTPPKPPHSRTRFPHLRTPSTQISFADPISPAESVEQPVVTILSPTSEQTVTSPLVNRRRQSHFSNEPDRSDDTLSAATPSGRCFSPPGQPIHDNRIVTGAPGQLNTNVNASHVLPALVSKDGRVRPRLSRTARNYASTADAIKLGVNQKKNSHYAYEPETEFHDPGDTASETDTPEKEAHRGKMLRNSEEYHLRQVPTVGSAECGQLCIPEWIVHRNSGKTHKSEDLLAEPKRSAFNKAVMAHRCRLVETILQADEERLEEIISVLLRD